MALQDSGRISDVAADNFTWTVAIIHTTTYMCKLLLSNHRRNCVPVPDLFLFFVDKDFKVNELGTELYNWISCRTIGHVYRHGVCTCMREILHSIARPVDWWCYL